jgi:hypothetical protein
VKNEQVKIFKGNLAISNRTIFNETYYLHVDNYASLPSEAATLFSFTLRFGSAKSTNTYKSFGV